MPEERRTATDAIAEARRILERAAPGAAKVFLAHFTGQENLPVPELILTALRRLPNGRIRRKNDKLAIKGISWLVDEVPQGDPRRTEIVQLFNEVLSRVIW